jgi:hypothetical protein
MRRKFRRNGAFREIGTGYVLALGRQKFGNGREADPAHADAVDIFRFAQFHAYTVAFFRENATVVNDRSYMTYKQYVYT